MWSFTKTLVSRALAGVSLYFRRILRTPVARHHKESNDSPASPDPRSVGLQLDGQADPHRMRYCGRRVCRTFHAAWCSVYARRSPQPNRDHHARHPCQPNHAITATPPSTPAQSLPTVPTAELIDTADSLAAALQKPVRNPRREAEELLQIRHAWLFPPSSHS